MENKGRILMNILVRYKKLKSAFILKYIFTDIDSSRLL